MTEDVLTSKRCHALFYLHPAIKKALLDFNVWVHTVCIWYIIQVNINKFLLQFLCLRLEVHVITLPILYMGLMVILYTGLLQRPNNYAAPRGKCGAEVLPLLTGSVRAFHADWSRCLQGLAVQRQRDGHPHTHTHRRKHNLRPLAFRPGGDNDHKFQCTNYRDLLVNWIWITDAIIMTTIL